MINIYDLPTEKQLLENIKSNPEDIHSILRLADYYVKRRKKRKALEFFTKAAEEYSSKGKFEFADAIYHVVEVLFPDEAIKKERKVERKEEVAFKREELKKFLRKIDLFKEFSDEHLDYLEKNSKIVDYSKNDTIISEGEIKSSLFVILKGNVKIYITTELGKIIELAILGQGEFFGEMAFFGDGKVRASVDAIEDVKILEIPKSTVEALTEKDERLKAALLKYYQERVLDIVLATSQLFHALDPKIRREILHKFKLVEFKAGDLIIREGETSESMYIIKSGVVEVFIEKNGVEKVLTELGEGEFFGEIAVLTGQKRTANVRAKTDVELMELTRADIDEIAQYHPGLIDILRSFVQQRTSDTFQKMMELRRISAKKGIV